jgi:RNA-splicing ligase RtcB
VGFASHACYPQSVQTLLEEISHQHSPSAFLASLAAKDKASAQLGTLGGGNHFLEVNGVSDSRAVKSGPARTP